MRFSLFLIITMSSAFAALWDQPILKLKPYSSLDFPPMMKKADFHYIVERAANKIPYKKAYYKLGHIGDLMHGHIMFNHRDGLTDRREFLGTEIDWKGLRPVAVFFHSQEYPSSWDDFFSGDELQQLIDLKRKQRNWVLWLNTTGLFHWKGRVQNAKWLMYPGVEPNGAYTLYDRDLDQKHFGKFPRVGGSWSFYFFKVDCEQVPERFREDSNFIQIFHKKQKKNICLLLENLRCRSSNSISRSGCPGVDIAELATLPMSTTTADLLMSP